MPINSVLCDVYHIIKHENHAILMWVKPRALKISYKFGKGHTQLGKKPQTGNRISRKRAGGKNSPDVADSIDCRYHVRGNSGTPIFKKSL